MSVKTTDRPASGEPEPARPPEGGRWRRRLDHLLERLVQPATYEAVYAERTRFVLCWLMVFLVAGLGFSVLYQRAISAHHCFQTSISAYYYTPARAIFVASLMAIGVCLLAMRGRTAAEDAMLNFAGILAPIVAIVPTPPPPTRSCDILAGQGTERAVDVANNMPALFLVGLLAFGLAVKLVYRSRDGAPPASAGERNAVLAAGALWVTALVAFFAVPDTFREAAHYTAAIIMFAAIVVVVGINGLLTAKQLGGSFRNRYTLIAASMLAWSAGMGLLGCAGWKHWVIAIETGLILGFAIFWGLQTSQSEHDDMQEVVTPRGPVPE